MSIFLTELASKKIKEIAVVENIVDPTLRIKVIGGGCAGFSYDLFFDYDPPGDIDKIFDSNGIRVVVDQMSLMYLAGTEVDYVEGLHGAGFKFQNPQTAGTCGCGQSFSV